jgi:integrase
VTEQHSSPIRLPARPITKTVVDRLKPGAIAWDAEVTGFGVRCQRRFKIFILKYRIFGQQRWISIGKHGAPWTVELARKEAKRLLGQVAAGVDPAEVRDLARADLTIAELCDLYLKEGCTTKKPSTVAIDRGRIERHIKPVLGKMRVHQVRKGDVEKLLREVAAGKTATDQKTGTYGRAIVKGGKGTANKAVTLLGAIGTFAVDRGLRPDNPAKGVKLYKSRSAERFLSADELSRLGEALSGAEKEGANPYAIAAIRLLALTGARKGEILSLHWQRDSNGAGYIDFNRSCLHLLDSKTGEKRVPLGAPALELLNRLPRIEGTPFVFPGKTGGHYAGLQKVWNQIRRRAGLEDVRLHDLRHSYASTAVASGDSLYLVGKVLGHRKASTTSRYAHLSDDPLRDVADRTARQIAAAMASDEGAGEVVDLFHGKGQK